MQNFDSGGKAIRRITGMVIAGLLAMLLLTGCSGDRVEFHNSWLSMERPLTSLSFEAGDWPVCEGGYVEWNLV